MLTKNASKDALHIPPQAAAAPSLDNRLLPQRIVNALYFYQAIVRSVYDGDTIRVDIDLGLHTWMHGEKVRLMRIDAPEVRGENKEEGLASRDYLRSLIGGKDIVVETYRDDKEKYGRYLAEVWVLGEEGMYINVNDAMVVAGHAIYKEY